MIHYKDRTFCPFHEECLDGKNCNRALTIEIEQKANSLGLPISQFKDAPDCFNIIPRGKENENQIQPKN